MVKATQWDIPKGHTSASSLNWGLQEAPSNLQFGLAIMALSQAPGPMFVQRHDLYSHI